MIREGNYSWLDYEAFNQCLLRHVQSIMGANTLLLSTAESILLSIYHIIHLSMLMSTIDVDIFGNDIVATTGFDPFIRAIMENSNEKQTKELLELFIKKFGNIMPTSDIQIPQHEFVALYRYSDFLTQEFYSIFGQAIKRFNVDPDFDIYFKKDVSDTLLGRLKGHITRKIDRKFRPEEYAGETGVVDYEKVRRLGSLISEWEQEYVLGGLVEGVTPDDLIRGVKLEELEPEVIKKIFALRRQKDAIMEGMIDDLTRYTQYRNMQELVLSPEQLAALGLTGEPGDTVSPTLDVTDTIKRGYIDEDQMED